MSRVRESRENLAPAGLTTPRAAGVAGVLFSVLFTVSVLLVRSFVMPESSGSLAGVANLTVEHASIVPSYLLPFAGIAFLWFIGVVRDRIGVYEDQFFATVFLGSGVVFVAMMFAAASVLAGLLTLTQPTGATTELGQSIGRAMFYMFGARSAGVFTLVTSMIVLRTGALPKWAAYISLVVGLILLLGVQAFEMVILLFPAKHRDPGTSNEVTGTTFDQRNGGEGGIRTLVGGDTP
jgi:hypothetical protein